MIRCSFGHRAKLSVSIRQSYKSPGYSAILTLVIRTFIVYFRISIPTVIAIILRSVNASDNKEREPDRY